MNLESQINQLVIKKAISKIDMDALVTRAMPMLEKQIIKELERAAKELDLGDAMIDAFPYREFNKILRKTIAESFKARAAK